MSVGRFATFLKSFVILILFSIFQASQKPSQIEDDDLQSLRNIKKKVHSVLTPKGMQLSLHETTCTMRSIELV